MTPLSAKRRSELRAEAHKLDPVVLIGDKGLTDEVIAEIDRSLKAHELIKVRAATGERDADLARSRARTGTMAIDAAVGPSRSAFSHGSDHCALRRP